MTFSAYTYLIKRQCRDLIFPFSPVSSMVISDFDQKVAQIFNYIRNAYFQHKERNKLNFNIVLPRARFNNLSQLDDIMLSKVLATLERS